MSAVHLRFWEALEARDWDRLGATLAPDVEATWPQTRERCRGRDALVEFMRTFPGDWHVEVVTAHADEQGAATRVASTLDGEAMEALTFFTVADELVTSLVEFWPESYDPPGRATPLERY